MTTMEKMELAKTVQAHFPDAPDADVRLACDACHGMPLAACQKAVEQHRLDLGTEAYRPSPNALASRASQLAGIVDSSPAAKMTKADIEARREVTRRVSESVAVANDIISRFGPDAINREHDAMLAAFRTGKLTRDETGKPDPEVGNFRADAIEKRPTSEASRLALAAWLEGVA